VLDVGAAMRSGVPRSCAAVAAWCIDRPHDRARRPTAAARESGSKKSDCGRAVAKKKARRMAGPGQFLMAHRGAAAGRTRRRLT
jgi:hypothetical protein